MIYWMSLQAIVGREFLRFMHQKERFLAALVRPLVWLFIFAAGFRAALGLSIEPPYSTYIRYETYIVPGLCAMIQLFNAMQSALAMVYDHEMGAMRLLLTGPLPRWWVLFSKALASVLVSLFQVYAFLVIAWLYDIREPWLGYASLLPMLLLTGLMLSGFGLVLSSWIKRLQNFSGVMNFVIFPMFFMSTALYPMWKLQENAPSLAMLANFNPFTHAVELLRFALYQQLSVSALWVVLGFGCICFAMAIVGYNPRTFLMKRRG